jgi:multidrug efflux system membrane fusion protein
MSEPPAAAYPAATNLPPPKPPARESRGWLWLLLFAVASGAGYYFYDRLMEKRAAEVAQKATEKGKGKGGPTPVVAVPARKGEINVHIYALGTVTPLRTVTVRSRVDGQLMRVHFKEGDLVKQGQLLAEIDPRPFNVQLQQAEGQLARDQALLANAKLDLERYTLLLKQDSIAKQQVDSQAALVQQYEGVVKTDQGQVDSARLQLTYARVTAPISGRVGLQLVDPGNIVRSGDATGLVVITQLAPIGVVFTVPQDSLPALMKRVQSGETLRVEAWDREQKERLAVGRLLAVDNLVDVATGTVKLKASFRNEEDELFPNQFVNVRLRLETLEEQTVILQTAVQRGGRGLFVYVVREDNTVTARPVTLGPVDGPRVAVSKGLQPGDNVVIDGIDRLREGARVQMTKRPEFKPSIDGTSGARKKGKGKGKGEGKGGEGAAKSAATGAEPAGAPAADAQAESGDAPKKKRRRPPDDAAEKGAGAPSADPAAGDSEAPRKGRRKPPAEGETSERSSVGPPAETKAAAGAEGEEPRKKKGRRKPPAEGQEGDAPKGPPP